MERCVSSGIGADHLKSRPSHITDDDIEPGEANEGASEADADLGDRGTSWQTLEGM
jgi:hypothetical protein